jgi:hypothetical protein
MRWISDEASQSATVSQGCRVSVCNVIISQCRRNTLAHNKTLFSLSNKNVRAERAPTNARATKAPVQYITSQATSSV